MSQACEACAELHLKCDNEKPCSRCRTKGIFCQHQSAPSETEAIAHNLLSLSQSRHDGVVQPPNPPLASTQTHTTDQGPMFFSVSERATPVQSSPALHTHNHVRFADFDQSNNLAPSYHDAFDFNDTSHLTSVHDTFMSHTGDDGNELRDFLHDIMGLDSQAVPSSGIKSGAWTPRNLFEFGVDTNLELDDMDLGFLNDYNQNNPFGATPDASVSAVGSLVSDARSDPPLGVESLQKSSTWRFRPHSRDNRDNALSMPATESGKKFTVDRRVTVEPLTHNTRDQILAMIVSLNADTKAMLSFPSVDLLDSLMQYFLTSTSALVNLIHAPTFNPRLKRPELCAAMIAAGASLAPDASLRKFGLAIQEAIRLSLPSRIEKDNTLVRDLQLIQGAIIGLKIGLWSGNSRKMELAESFMQPWATMVRRAVS